jgi:hypothetical protein
MKFIDAIRAMRPGQLLTNQHGGKYEVKDGSLFHADSFKLVSELGYIYVCDWQVIDKPRPRVKFADAIAAAATGKLIKSAYSGVTYRLDRSYFRIVINGNPKSIDLTEMAGDWEIIEAEGGK